LAGALGLKNGPRPCIAGRSKERSMLALYIIVGFVVVLGVINFIEFGRVD
jgi:hypothetical protein